MKYTKWFLHPIFVFIFSVTALCASLFLYIYWYVGVNTRLQSVIKNFNLDTTQLFKLQTWVVILVLSILVALILSGIFIIFVYHLKSMRLYRLQNNFINSFTHELKTPVTSLQLYLEMFKKHRLAREMQHKYLNYMLEDVKRLTSNINRILTTANIESKTFEENLTTVNIVNFIDSFCHTNKQLFRNCQINLHHRKKTGLLCEVDQALFEMLLMNILSNSAKYNDSPNPTIDIVFSVKRDNVLIAFQDNGMGLEKNECKRIFKKFYLVDDSTKKHFKGSGLGLYLVDNIASLHKGRVIAESDGPGKGTTLTVTLPLVPSESNNNRYALDTKGI